MRLGRGGSINNLYPVFFAKSQHFSCISYSVPKDSKRSKNHAKVENDF